MKTVAFTFDDGLLSHYRTVAPLFVEHGFRCTFFITASRAVSKVNEEMIMEPSEVKVLHEAGFEIGNHTFSHEYSPSLPSAHFYAEVIHMQKLFLNSQLPAAKTFAFPGNRYTAYQLFLLRELGYKFIRVEKKESNSYYNLNNEEPWIVPTTLEVPSSFPSESKERFKVLIDNYFQDFVTALKSVPACGCAVFSAHSVKTPQLYLLQKVLKYCSVNGYNVVPLKDLPI